MKVYQMFVVSVDLSFLPGELSGLLADIGYTKEQVFKF